MDVFSITKLRIVTIKILSMVILCSGFVFATNAAQARAILLSPQTVNIQSNESMQFFAAWENSAGKASAQKSVLWSLSGCGKILKRSGMYYPPKEITGNSCQAIIKASFIDDPGRAGFSIITVQNNRSATSGSFQSQSVQISPKAPEIRSNQSQQFLATWANSKSSAQQNVFWSLTGCGKILKRSGMYYPPKEVPGKSCQATITVSAINNPKQISTAQITVKSHSVGATNAAVKTLKVSPAAPAIKSNQSLQFFAGWSGNSISSAQNKVFWSMSGCGKILKRSGMYYPPKEVSGKSCQATIKASAADNPALVSYSKLTVKNHRLSAPVKVTKPTPPVTPRPTQPPANPVIESPDGTLVVYSGVQQYKSDRFTVKVSQNGQNYNAFVYKSTNDSKPGWAGTLDYMQKANHWTNFSFAGSVNIEASRQDGRTIQSCVVRPLSLNIKPVIQGSSCKFSLTRAAQISVEIDENLTISESIRGGGKITKKIVKHPLFVFANPLEKNIPSPSAAGVIYFGPGLHRIGKHYKIPDNTEVYLAGGAFVIGTFYSEARHAQNVTVRGRGVLSGIGLTDDQSETNQWQNHSIDFSSGRRGQNILIEGITITDPLRSCIVSYSNNTLIRNVKLFSWSHRNDGITAGTNSTIEDSFIKVQDDNIKLYYGKQTVRRMVIWQQTAGAVFKFAWKLTLVSQNNQVSDIDIIHSDVFNDYSPSESDQPELRSTSAIFSSMGFNRNRAFKASIFRDIRIEEKYLYRLMGLRMVSSHAAANDPNKIVYWGDPRLEASKVIDGLTFENIQLASVPYHQSTLYGNKGGSINNIHFKGLKVNGVVIDSQNKLTSKKDGRGLFTAGNVSNVVFSR
ncbi:MAG: hypothetical protein V3W04_04215 [Gammaproteobacteria bacterium]